MNELAAIVLFILICTALIFVCGWAWIGFLMWRQFGFEKALDVIAAFSLARDLHTDGRMKAGMKELNSKGEL